MSEQENLKEQGFKYVVSIKFSSSKKAYNFGTNDETLRYGDKVVVETVRGIELGEMISDLRPFSTYSSNLTLKPITRKATNRDIENDARNKRDTVEATKQCQKCIDELGLEMYLISTEYTLDRSKIIFSYVADDRVDFRELLKKLAAIFKCRIELRQIGARDKAKIIGGLGTCGMETCCSRFLDDFDIVSINMAKNQLLALNTQKLSGQCGKLMCCLKYEDENYKCMRKGLPKLNASVEYQGQRYRITSMNLLNQTVHIANRENAVDMTLAELKSHLHIEDAPDNSEQAAESED
ncbi:MAG: stage 0 sporulation protein [Erysipelotrichaceae bacterium]|nr:stage 0 sporulation protein [Erysipelotrichaceae bacterium]